MHILNYLDFNLKKRKFECVEIGCSKDNKNHNELKETLKLKNYLLLNNKNTTHKSFSDGKKDILDLCNCSTDLYKNFVKIDVYRDQDMGSDHFPVRLQFEFDRDVKNQKTIGKNKFNFDKANWTTFKSELPTSFPALNLSVEEQNDFLTKSIREASIKAIPLKKENQEFVETLPSYILKLIDIKHQWRKLARSKLSTSEHKRKYNMITKIVQEEIIAHKNKKWEEFLSSVGKNPTSSKPFWQKINKIRNKTINSASSKTIKNLVYDGKEYQSELEQADLFGRLLQETFSDSNK